MNKKQKVYVASTIHKGRRRFGSWYAGEWVTDLNKACFYTSLREASNAVISKKQEDGYMNKLHPEVYKGTKYEVLTIELNVLNQQEI